MVHEVAEDHIGLVVPKTKGVILENNGTGPDRLVPFIRDKALPWLAGEGLDIGCGPEKVLHSAIGVDDQSQYRGAADLVMDVHNLPDHFAGKRFDYIFSSHLLEHLADWRDVLGSWKPLLKEGGVLFLYLPNVYANPHWSCQHPEAAKRTHHVVDLVPQVVVQVLKDLGMEIVEYNQLWDEYACYHVIARRPVCR